MPITVGYTPAKLAGDLAAVSGRNRGALLYEQVKSGRIRDSIAKENLKLAKRGQRAQEDEADRRNELAQQELDQRRRDAGIRNAMGLLEMTNRENALTLAREIQQAQFGRGADLAEDKFTYGQEQDVLTRELGAAAVKEEAIRYGVGRKYEKQQDLIRNTQAQERIDTGKERSRLTEQAQMLKAQAAALEMMDLPVHKHRDYLEDENRIKVLEGQRKRLEGDIDRYEDRLTKGQSVFGEAADRAARHEAQAYIVDKKQYDAVRGQLHQAEQSLTSTRSRLLLQRSFADPAVRSETSSRVAQGLVENGQLTREIGMDGRDDAVFGYYLTNFDLRKNPHVKELAIETQARVRHMFGDPPPEQPQQ
jgi:hypothetical protein